MQPFQFNYPEQERIYHRFNALVGQGAAAFYKNACQLMAMDDPLESTTHLVGHLLREVDSSLRAVLKPISEQPARQKGSSEEKHRNEILAILKTLEIPETSTIAENWLKLAGKKGGEEGLNKRAHREDLAPPRIIDERFQDFWRQINLLLEEILDRFETRAAQVRMRLDALLLKPEPTKQDINFLRLNTPNSHFALGYFFERLESPAWLKPLYEAGFFKNPPGMETDAEAKTFRFPVWAQSRYLIKVAPYEPEIVLAIATQLLATDSDNIRLYQNLVEAALRMPPDFAACWVEQAIKWLGQQTHLDDLLSETLGELIAYLARENQVEAAINLARELLTVLPQPNSSSLGGPFVRLNEYYYAKIIKKHLSELTEYQPDLVLTLLCDLLNNYLNSSSFIKNERFSEDFSSIWCPTLGRSSENPYEIRNMQANAIWDITKQIIERDPNQVRSLFQKLQSYRWRIFDRICLYLLRCFPESVSDLLVERLTERDRLEGLGLYLESNRIYYSHEHALLLKEQFTNLPIEDQEQILLWLAEGPTDVMEIEPQMREAYIKHWQRDWFSIINDYLPSPLKQLYNQLVGELGAATSLDSIFGNTENTARSASKSPKSGIELAEMAEGNMDKLFTYLQECHQPGKLSESSRNRLAWELAEQVIAPNPQQFVAQIERFKTLEPQFTVWLLRGLKKALDNLPNEQSAFSWEPVVDFCAWILENLKDIRERNVSENDTEWSQICEAIVELINTGLSAKGANNIPLTLRRQVWQLLSPLTREPQVTPGFTAHYQSSNMSPYEASFNTVRCKAMHAVMRYAFWVRQDANGKAQASQNFDDLPEVQQVLEQHLDPQQEPSSAIRAVYGSWFPYLLHLASNWVRQQSEQIFPEEPTLQWLFEAAWKGYVSFNQVYAEIFSLLRKKYSYAVGRLPFLTFSSYEQLKSSRALSNHLLDLFWHSVIDLGESDSLLEEFFAKAPTYPREEFMRGISWRLLYGNFKVEQQLRQRLQNFLEWRIDQAKEPTATLEQMSDLKYFSWLFASGKLDERWAITKLVDILKLFGTVTYCQEFLKRLENLAPVMPEDVVQCLCQLADSKQSVQWFTSYKRDRYCAILQAVVQSGNKVAKKEVINLINRLVARNLGDFRELLN